MKRSWYVLALFLVLTGGFCPARAGEKADAWAESFCAPPDSAKPWANWWWLNGNVSKEGITQDLEEMKRQGINGEPITPTRPTRKTSRSWSQDYWGP